MTKIFYPFLVLIGLSIFSCQQTETKAVSFTFIDLTYSNGWTELVSVHLDSNKCVRIRIDRHGNMSTFLQGTLPDPTFIKIDSLALAVLNIQHDTLNGQPVPDGGACNIIVKSKTKEIRVMNWAGETCCNQLNGLMYNVIKLKDKIKNISTDTSFVFPSFWRFVPPPMADGPIEFVAPKIKDDRVDKSASQ